MQFRNKLLLPSGFKIKRRYKYFLDLSIMNDKSEDTGFYELAKNPLTEHLSMMILDILSKFSIDPRNLREFFGSLRK